jgi:dienelactone hydrolase
MKRVLIVCGSIAALAIVSSASPQGAVRDVGRELPLEGAPLAVPGPYDVTSGPAFGSAGHVVFHPADLDAFPSRDSLPVVAWGNGGCAIDSTRYSGFLRTIASHGFLVLSTVPVEGAERRRATADDLSAALDWAEAEDTRQDSPLEGRVATDRMAVMGQSCGGGLSISLGDDSRVDTIAPFNFGVSDTSELERVHGPVLLINGGEVDFMYEPSAANFDAIDHVPAFYGARDNAGHTATALHPGGGEFANVASNWLRWILKGDEGAGAMFAGDDCTLCIDPNWETRSKGWE